MTERKVERGREMLRGAETVANDGTRTKHGPDDDLVAVHHLDVELREYGFPTIFAGFQMEWGRVDVDGDDLTLYSGAGLGSAWATVSFRGKHYAIDASQLVEQVLAAVASETLQDNREEGGSDAEA